MNPRIEPPPRDNLKRAIFAIHSWTLQAGDVAIHEAGHIVAGRALGMPCNDARVSPDGASGRAGVLSPVGDNGITNPPPPDEVARVYLQAACLIWPGLGTAEAALNYAVMLVAGRQAELIAAGHRLSGELRMHDPDHQQCRAILAASDQRLAMTWAQRQARHLLTTAWTEVEAIANTLREQGRWINSTQWER
ncbi:hypothetical protein [Thiobacillus denitrificans]|uniref:hypothetical protein n=1 Tax=Thiobacillus denitrificans TaxID=36861 RepID=UPI0012F9BF16|nr:hypothetical protein [Thiobacillus denitrificans]